jgi:pimeloyl-ACP methyl ester carboxylesterase
VGEALDQSAHSKVLALFLKGDRSEYVTTSDFEIIKEHFPNSKIETVSNAGHWLHAENPDMFYERVLKFIY